MRLTEFAIPEPKPERNKDSRILVTYDVNWDKFPKTKTLYDVGQSDKEAIKSVRSLVGGRNHRVERFTK